MTDHRDRQRVFQFLRDCERFLLMRERLLGIVLLTVENAELGERVHHAAAVVRLFGYAQRFLCEHKARR